MTLEAVEQLRIPCLTRCGLAEHDDVEPRQCRLVGAERLANDALDPVPPRSPATVFLGDGEPESGRLLIVAEAEYRKPLVAASGPFFENPVERCRIEQAPVSTEPEQGSASLSSG